LGGGGLGLLAYGKPKAEILDFKEGKHERNETN
jgi:hypothetical protein